MMDHPNIIQMKMTIKDLNTLKAPGLDGIPVPILLHEVNILTVEIYHLISEIWLNVFAPQDFVDDILINFFKGK